MAFEFLNALPIPADFTLLGLFFVFLIIGVFIFKTVTKILIIGAVAAAFPLFAGYFGYAIELTFKNIIGFAVLGMSAALVWLTISWIIKIIK